MSSTVLVPTQTSKSLDIKTPGYFPGIDGLRGAAAYLVYLIHTWQFAGAPNLALNCNGTQLSLARVITTFYTPVDMFMIISGFCLFLPLARSKNIRETWNTKQFFVRRLWRLCPAYYASMIYVVAVPTLLVLLFRCLHIKATWQPLPDVWQWITHALFIHTFFAQTWSGFNGPLWTLGVEAQLYAAFPLAVFGYIRFGAKVFPVIMLLSILYQILGCFVAMGGANATDQVLWSINLLGRWVEFGFGMMAAWTVVNFNQLPQSAKTIIKYGWIGVLPLYVLAIAAVHITPLYLMVITAAGGLLLLNTVCTTNIVNRFFSSRPLVFAGTISFSFYLLHQCTAWYFSQLLRRYLHLDGVLLLACLATVGYALVMLLAYGFFLAFEKPFLKGKMVINRGDKKTSQLVRT